MLQVIAGAFDRDHNPAKIVKCQFLHNQNPPRIATANKPPMIAPITQAPKKSQMLTCFLSNFSIFLALYRSNCHGLSIARLKTLYAFFIKCKQFFYKIVAFLQKSRKLSFFWVMNWQGFAGGMTYKRGHIARGL